MIEGTPQDLRQQTRCFKYRWTRLARFSSTRLARTISLAGWSSNGRTVTAIEAADFDELDKQLEMKAFSGGRTKATPRLAGDETQPSLSRIATCRTSTAEARNSAQKLSDWVLTRKEKLGCEFWSGFRTYDATLYWIIWWQRTSVIEDLNTYYDNLQSRRRVPQSWEMDRTMQTTTTQIDISNT